MEDTITSCHDQRDPRVKQRNSLSQLERVSRDRRKTKSKAIIITATIHNRNKQRDEPI